MSGSIWHSKLTVPVSPARDHIRGPVDALVTLVEYGDYECPHCGAAHAIVKAIMGQVDGAVRFVFRHFPMTTVHPHAELAAEAADAAGHQHRFWDMHDTLFANQQRLDGPSLLAYGSMLRLDFEQFDREVTGHVHLPRITEDFMSGVRSGVNGTPTFFINGIRHDGAWDYGSLIGALQLQCGSIMSGPARHVVCPSCRAVNRIPPPRPAHRGEVRQLPLFAVSGQTGCG